MPRSMNYLISDEYSILVLLRVLKITDILYCTVEVFNHFTCCRLSHELVELSLQFLICPFPFLYLSPLFFLPTPTQTHAQIYTHMHAYIHVYMQLQVPFQMGKWSSGFLASWCRILPKEPCCSWFGDINDMIVLLEPSLTALSLPLSLSHPAFCYWQNLGSKETSFLIPEDLQSPVSRELYFSSSVNRHKCPTMVWTWYTVT